MKRLFFLFLLSLPLIGWSQANILGYFNTSRQKINKTGMIVLGSWAVGNIGVNGYLWPQAQGSQKYFYQMNTYWNVVNLGIAGYGYYRASKEDLSDYDMDESVHAQHKTERIYLINAVLDVGYIVTGVYLQSVRHTHPHKERLLGYGQSVFWQGIFLVVFDSAMFIAHNANLKNSDLLMKDLSFNFSGNGVGVKYRF